MAKARACFRCNSKDHTIKDCPHSENVCYNCFWTWANVVADTEMLCTLGCSKTSLVQFDAPRMTLCVAITGWDSLENTQFVVVLSSFVINVDSVVLSLGTNDVTQYRNDTEQIIVNVTTCVENVKHKYPNASIGVCSILDLV
jgi:hypothetical protein